MIEMWTVYDHPLDYPDGFIARKFRITGGNIASTAEVKIGKTLDEIREQLPSGLTCFNRDSSDDVAIVEMWM